MPPRQPWKMPFSVQDLDHGASGDFYRRRPSMISWYELEVDVDALSTQLADAASISRNDLQARSKSEAIIPKLSRVSHRPPSLTALSTPRPIYGG